MAVNVSPEGSVSVLQLRDIKDQRVRNLIRGLFSSENSQSYNKTMERLRGELSERDAATAFRYLRDSPLSQHIILPVAFPLQTSEVNQVPFFEPARLEIELASPSILFEREEVRIASAISHIAEINKAILDSDVATAERHFAVYQEKYGLSLMVVFKAISLRHSALGRNDHKLDVSAVISPFLSPKRQIPSVTFEESVDSGRDYMRVRRSFLGLVVDRRIELSDAAIVADIFSPSREFGFNASQKLQSYCRWGVVDTLAYLFRLRHVYASAGDIESVNLINKVIPHSIINSWESNFSSIDSKKLLGLVGVEDQFYERALFAHLPIKLSSQATLLRQIGLNRATASLV
jgi:hypothetical protein